VQSYAQALLQYIFPLRSTPLPGKTGHRQLGQAHLLVLVAALVVVVVAMVHHLRDGFPIFTGF
jgi:hypothetical protein